MPRFARLLGGLAIVYGVAPVIAFDFTGAAPSYDEEHFEGRPVAIGPRPRGFACRPTDHDLFWAGDEWPFLVFRPVCRIRLHFHGYAPPGEWR